MTMAGSVAVKWVGDKAFAWCLDCEQLIRINKPVVGTLHICISDCQKAGRHLEITERRAGPFWHRYTKWHCDACQDEGRIAA